MIKIFYSVCILILASCSVCAQNGGIKSAAQPDIKTGVPAATNIRQAKYPLILPDHRVVFRVQAPDAKKIQVDLGRKYNMQRDSSGAWTATTDSIGEGFHYYSLLIDGVAVADPASESFYGMGRMASGIEIPFAQGGYYEERDVPHGDIRTRKYYSAVAKAWRNILIYTPPGYDVKTSEKFPVLYILHGGGEDERGWANQGKTDVILDNLIAEKRAKPMLVVMPDANFSGAGFSEEYLLKVEEEIKGMIIPFIEKNYRVKADPSGRALAGLSMGGLNTLYTGIKNNNMFSSLGVFSSGWIIPMQNDIAGAQYDLMKKNGAVINKNLKNFWIAMGGKQDIAYKNCQVMLAKFKELNINYTYYEYPGGHTWPVWRNNLYHFAPLLFQ
jgi:enterochelin esterase-like enzyme